jgi:acetyltransferase-like isoleucine patch superfamily enzyme
MHMIKFLKIITRWSFTLFSLTRIGTYKETPNVFFYSRFSKKTYLGKNTNFNGMNISGCGVVRIGDNFHSGKGCMIITQNHNYEGGHIPYDDTYVCKDVYIEDNVWLGHRVIVLGGVQIGEGAIIQAGSVITSNIPKYSIAGGHPAKVFSSRDANHYEKLKKLKRFH